VLLSLPRFYLPDSGHLAWIGLPCGCTAEDPFCLLPSELGFVFDNLSIFLSHFSLSFSSASCRAINMDIANMGTTSPAMMLHHMASNHRSSNSNTRRLILLHNHYRRPTTLRLQQILEIIVGGYLKMAFAEMLSRLIFNGISGQTRS
jgi:hypothetical protein